MTKWNWILEDVGCFKVARFLILFNVIKAELLGVSPTVTKDGKEREAEGGEQKKKERNL